MILLSQTSNKMRCLVWASLAIILTVNKAVDGGWIDVDTPQDAYTTKSFIDNSTYHLVMSDEFNVPNRAFGDGDDPTWTALDKSDDDSNAAGGGSLHFYNSSCVTTTENGMLKIDSTIGSTSWNHYDARKKKYRRVDKYFKSGMVQSWNKFCFTGGIIEVDVIFPGDPYIGGLWPAVWLLGNLGRATYEATTNNIWPWSYNKCDRQYQDAQRLSACNEMNHYGMNPKQGRGATEIDILEVLTGKPDKLPQTKPPISLPYIDCTLQVAPGVPHDRPIEGYQPQMHTKMTPAGHVEKIAQKWYDGLEFYGNTSLNPFFYGTYLGVTKPNEPVQRNKKQAFQADAVGGMHQITKAHFEQMHSFRLEWQPGPGGRLDWFTKAYRTNPHSMENSTEKDGKGEDWVKVISIKDESISELMGSQIPNEPSYIIFNTAISSSWGFPYKLQPWCKPCYDCSKPQCQCAFNSGFCQMLEKNVTMYIDSVRVYQSHNASAHPGNNHTVGCDPVEYPTKEWIKGHAYLYSRQPPFSYDDTGPLKKVKKGGAPCKTDDDCGAAGIHISAANRDLQKGNASAKPSNYLGGRGKCVPAAEMAGHLPKKPKSANVCKCNAGFTGPRCLAIDHKDDEKGAYELSKPISIFHTVATPFVPSFILVCFLVLFGLFLIVVVANAYVSRRRIDSENENFLPAATRST